jgi:hypothetical protein
VTGEGAHGQPAPTPFTGLNLNSVHNASIDAIYTAGISGVATPGE